MATKLDMLLMLDGLYDAKIKDENVILHFNRYKSEQIKEVYKATDYPQLVRLKKITDLDEFVHSNGNEGFVIKDYNLDQITDLNIKRINNDYI